VPLAAAPFSFLRRPGHRGSGGGFGSKEDVVIEDAIRTLLVSDSTVTGFVGTDPGARIHAIVLPATPTLPAVTYQRIANTPEFSHDGTAIERPRIQLTSWAATYSQAKDLAAAVRAVVAPPRVDGTAGFSRTVGTVEIQRARLFVERDFYDADTTRYRVQADYIVSAVE
jgi:hypothetical protein